MDLDSYLPRMKTTTTSKINISDFLKNFVTGDIISEIEKAVIISRLEKLESVPLDPFTCARIERDIRTMNKEEMTETYWRIRNRIFKMDYKLMVGCILLDVTVKHSENQELIRFLHACILEAALNNGQDKRE